MIAYIDKGEGPVLVLLHGFCETKELWEHFIDVLALKYRVIAPDMPGFGESTYLQSTHLGIEVMADEVCKLLIQLNIEKCTLIGHSLGGYVTLAFSEKYKDMLNGIGLFHSTAFEDSDEKKDSRNKVIRYVEQNGVESFIIPFVPPLFFYKKRQELDKQIAKAVKYGLTTPLETIVAVTKAMRDRPDRTHILEALNIPVMFIVGKEDNSVPLESSMKQIHLPQKSVVHILSNVAHMGMFEDETATLLAVEDFVRYCNLH